MNELLLIRNSEICMEYQAGVAVCDLAEKYGKTQTRIRQILKPVREPKWKKKPLEVYAKIVEMWRSGMSGAAIGREVGLSRERVRQILMFRSYGNNNSQSRS